MDLTKRLAGKIAVVSGCTTGIGAASAHRLAAEGAIIVAADINLASAQQVAEGIVADGRAASAAFVDITDEDSVVALFSTIHDQHGELHILHNNAAATEVEQMRRDLALTEMETEVWDHAFAVNARGTMLMIKHAIPHMIAAGGGSIINTSSGAALRGDLYLPAYAASKAAIHNLSLYAASQFGRLGIRVNVLCPGLVMTPNVIDNNTPEELDRIERHSLTPYLGRPEDMAAVVAFLASDDARYVNGHILTADGGYTSHMPHTGELMDSFVRDPSRRVGAGDTV